MISKRMEMGGRISRAIRLPPASIRLVGLHPQPPVHTLPARLRSLPDLVNLNARDTYDSPSRRSNGDKLKPVVMSYLSYASEEGNSSKAMKHLSRSNF